MGTTVRRVCERLGSSRAQSETVGVVLLLGLTIIGAGAVVGLGSVALDDAKQSATAGSAEHGMTQFDSQASLVAHGEADTRTVRLAGADDAKRTVDPSQGWMNVSIVNVTDGSVETVVMNETLGAVIYEDGDRTIAYQGGGVWRKTGAGNGSVMLSPAEFHYRGSTLTLPLVLIRGNGTLDNRARIRSGPTSAKYPNATRSLKNPLDSNKVVVTIHSEYYQAWGRFISQRTGGQVTTHDENKTVVAELVPPEAGPDSVGSALSSSSAGDEVDMQGSGSNPARIDSYNSSQGDYAATQSGNGTLLTAGDVKMAGNSEILGNVRSGGAVSMKGSSNVTREVEWTSGFTAGGSATYGSEEKISGVDGVQSQETLVDNKLAAIQRTNDNAAASDIQSEQLNFTGGTATLSDGDYYLEDIDAESGEELVLETNGNQIEIAVEESVQLDDAKISVKGGGIVRFYVGDDIQIESGSNVTVPDQRSTGLWMYGDPGDTSVTIDGDSSDVTRFVGVIYVPSEDGGDVSIQHSEVFGSIVGGDLDVENGATVHYDASLLSVGPLPQDANQIPITYLHVSATPVEVSD